MGNAFNAKFILKQNLNRRMFGTLEDDYFFACEIFIETSLFTSDEVTQKRAANATATPNCPAHKSARMSCTNLALRTFVRLHRKRVLYPHLLPSTNLLSIVLQS
jgi:hypothetical protein